MAGGQSQGRGWWVTTREEAGTGQKRPARMNTSRVQIQSNGTFWEFLRVVVLRGRGFLAFSIAYRLVNPSTSFSWRERNNPRITST